MHFTYSVFDLPLRQRIGSPGERNSFIDTNLLHHQRIRRGETNRPPACHPDLTNVILNTFVALSVNFAKHLGPTSEILRFAQDDKWRGSQDDKRALSIPATFLPTLSGLLNKYVEVKGAIHCSPTSFILMRHYIIDFEYYL